VEVWIQILLISLGISIFSQFLNKIMKMDSKHIKAMQTRLRELSKELDASRGSGGPVLEFAKPARSAQEVNAELMVLMKKMTKEQLLPMGIRCGIFWGIFAILGAIYGSYERILSFDVLFFGHGWVGAYFLFSIIIGFSIFGLKFLYKKLTHQDQHVAPEVLGMELPRVSWKDRLEAAKKELQGEDRPENPPAP
jgi:uncharacterized membrane protein (DUF106 family)